MHTRLVKPLDLYVTSEHNETRKNENTELIHNLCKCVFDLEITSERNETRKKKREDSSSTCVW